MKARPTKAPAKTRSRTATSTPEDAEGAGWTFFTNHTHVLVYLATRGDAPLRNVAEAIGITERAVQRIVRDLELAGVLQRERVGRRNHYVLCADRPLRHPLERHCSIGRILEALTNERTAPDMSSSRR